MATLVSRIVLQIAATLSNALDLVAATAPLDYRVAYDLANGTGANQANNVFSDQRTLGASATENLDLSGGLTNAFGASLVFTKIKALIVRAAAANVNDVLVGGAASLGAISFFGDATDVVRVRPGGVVALVAPDATGYAITAGTADILKITNSAGTTGVTYDITIVGVE